MSGPFSIGHVPASPSDSPPASNLRSRGSSVSSNRASCSLSPSRPSPALSPLRSPVVPPSPTSPSRRRIKRQADDLDTDDQSEVARSEASTRGAWTPSLQGPGSKRARQLMDAVQRNRPDRLTEAMLEAKVAADASSPAHNLRSHAARTTLPAARSSAPMFRSPQREHVQLKMVSFLVQTRSPGVRRVATTPESYISQAVDNGDGADLLRASCALGFLLSADGASAEPHDALSYIDDAVLAATKAFRSVAADLASAVEELLVSGEEKIGSLLNMILINGMKGIRSARRSQRKGSLSTSFLYHEVAAHEVPALDSLGRACFCLCMWTFMREYLREQKKPCLRVSVSADSPREFWLSVSYSARGGWRHFHPGERGVREVIVDAVALRPNQPYSPLHLIGALLERFWAEALASCAQQAGGERHVSSSFCSKWLSYILDLDRDKGLGLSQSIEFVSSIRLGLEQGRVLARCLPELVALIARHAEERADVPPSPLRSCQPVGGGSDSRDLWAAYSAVGTLISMSSGTASVPGGGGRMPTQAIMRAAEHVGQAADTVMSRAHVSLRRGSPANS